MSGFETNKIMGAITASLLVLMVANMASKTIFHSEKMSEPVYAVADKTADVKIAGDSAPIPLPLATAKAEDGEKVFKKCAGCHTYEKGGPTKQGPNLHGIIGQKIASIAGFDYSSGIVKKSDGPWTWDKLDAFLTNPKGWAPGTKMGFAGIAKPEDRAALLVWLNKQSDAPIPLP